MENTGLSVILVMPSDILIMLTVGTNLEQTDSSFVEALPKVRDWMNNNAWAVNVIVCCIFIVLILA
jgi:hypothetical protein